LLLCGAKAKKNSVMKLMSKYGDWLRDNGMLNTVGICGGASGLAAYFAAGVTTAKFGLGVGIVYVYIFYEVGVTSELYYDLWYNDPQFVALFKTAETYANLLLMGCDCEQEAMDAFISLEVYILQQKHGDDWRKYAKTSTLQYYDEMMKRQQLPPTETGSDVEHDFPPNAQMT